MAASRTAEDGGPAVSVSTPGKLILMGEHAVVYGRPALVAALDLRLRAHFSPLSAPTPAPDDAVAVADAPPENAADVEIDLPSLAYRTTCSWADILGYAGAARDGWTAYAAHPDPDGFRDLRGDDPAHIVKVALGEAAAALLGHDPDAAPPAATAAGTLAPHGPLDSRTRRRRLRLRVESDLPIGSGFGSSAAAAVAVIAGYAAWSGVEMSFPTIERLALEAERRQHGLPSGVDTATSLYGGLLWARRMAPPDGELRSETLAATSPLLGRLRVVHTGMPPEPTGAVVAAVRARRDRDPAACDALFDRMAAATRALRDQLALAAEEPARVVELIREHESCLEALGVVPGPVRGLVRQIEEAGGAAKISGAGSLAGPGAGSLLIYHPQPARVAGWDFLAPFPFHPVLLGAAGFRRDLS